MLSPTIKSEVCIYFFFGGVCSFSHPFTYSNLITTSNQTQSPANIPTFLAKQYRNYLSPNLCMDLKQAIAENGNPVWLYTCNGSDSQNWILDSYGRLRSQVDENYCIEGGRDRNLYRNDLSISAMMPCTNAGHWQMMVGSRTRAMENTLGSVVDAEGWPVKGSLSFTATCQGTRGKIEGTNKGGRPTC